MRNDHLPHPHRERLYSDLEAEGWENRAGEIGQEVMGWIYNPKRAELDEMQWHVVQWLPNGSIDRHLAICANPDLAVAAYESAILKWPDKEITCRHGSRILREHKARVSSPLQQDRLADPSTE